MMIDNSTSQNANETNEVKAFSKAATVGKVLATHSLDKTLINLKTLSLRPSRSVKRNRSVRPLKKIK